MDLKKIFQLVLERAADRILTPERVQDLLKQLFEELEKLAEKTTTPLDDMILAILKSVLTTQSKAEKITEWLKDHAIARRCADGPGEGAASGSITDLLTYDICGEKKLLEAAAWEAVDLLEPLAEWETGGKECSDV